MAVIEQEIQEKELEQLVSLAEEVSGKIVGLKEEYFGVQSFILPIRMKQIVIVSLILLIAVILVIIQLDNTKFAFSLMSPLIGFLIGVILIGFTGVNIMTSQLNSKEKRRYKLRTEITQEQKILGELLNMIHSYKELAFQDMSVVSRAVFEMRLSRIHFSAGDDFEVVNG